MADKDPFAGGQDVTPNQARFNKVGDYIIGFFTGSKEINGTNGPIKLYSVKGIQGEYHEAESDVDANGNKVTTIVEPGVKVNAGDYYNIFGGKDSIDDLFKKAKIGQKVGLRFEEAIASKTKGNSPFKVIKPVMWDEFDKTNPMDEGAIDSRTVEGIDF